VAWRAVADYRESFRAARVSADGTLLDREPFLLRPPVNGLSSGLKSLAGASDGNEYPVAFVMNELCGDQPCVDVYGNAKNPNLYAVIVGADGSVQDFGAPIAIETSSDTALAASAVWDGRSFIVSWQGRGVDACTSLQSCHRDDVLAVR